MTHTAQAGQGSYLPQGNDKIAAMRGQMRCAAGALIFGPLPGRQACCCDLLPFKVLVWLTALHEQHAAVSIPCRWRIGSKEAQAGTSALPGSKRCPAASAFAASGHWCSAASARPSLCRHLSQWNSHLDMAGAPDKAHACKVLPEVRLGPVGAQVHGRAGVSQGQGRVASGGRGRGAVGQQHRVAWRAGNCFSIQPQCLCVLG